MKLAVVILAAGRGERMNSALPKVLHKISGKAMLQHVIDSASKLKPSRTIVVAGRQYKEIKDTLKGSNILFAIQKEPKGTGDAVLKARTFLEGFKGTVLILNGDAPLVTAEALLKFLGLHGKSNNDISLISFVAARPAAYGRIVRDESDNILSIAEERDATDVQKKITEVNSGIYAVKSGLLGLLKEIRLNTLKNEYYLTDIIGIAKSKACKVEAYCIGFEDEMMGINTMPELLKAQQAYRKRLINNWMGKGITFFDSDSVFIYPEVMIGKGTTIYPDVFLEGKTKIGRGCTIYPNVRIIDSVVKDGAVIKDSTVIEGSVVMAGAVVGPFAHIRPGSEIGAGAKIGNFVEVKKSIIGKRTKASHLSYLGDASIGNDVNIGAGTITCNYDGKEKRRTTIEDRVFVGSDTQFIAPVRVGRDAYIGAGSTITKSVPPKALALSRAEQRNIKDWAKKRKGKASRGQAKKTV
ncbi:MAG: bifunctional UDP-N-acetylglucosamine diphosphorylase/glucosamine-1-phosphate N-acetyltransferase GlmU [Nitrospirae bacterium]|nr:bifunctional UDP-N-acetylglucosamine diphosphorylase/glucosamine-1-phosphate N-acetyltransferase GlmU [Nitrospirota bacterium]